MQSHIKAPYSQFEQVPVFMDGKNEENKDSGRKSLSAYRRWLLNSKKNFLELIQYTPHKYLHIFEQL